MTTELQIVICTNTESMRHMAEDACTCAWIPDDNTEAKEAWEANADHYTDRLILAAISACPPDYETDSHYPNWNGGKYSHQMRMHNYAPIACGVVRVIEVTPIVDEDGDDDGEDREVVPLANWSGEHRREVEALEAEIDAALAEEAEAIQRDYACDIIERLLERVTELESELAESTD